MPYRYRNKLLSTNADVRLVGGGEVPIPKSLLRTRGRVLSVNYASTRSHGIMCYNVEVPKRVNPVCVSQDGLIVL